MVLPGSSIGRYLVKRKLAEGGMAEIYLCTAVGPEGFEKEVVIKRIKAFLSSDQGFIDMFKAEARLASRLNHANVVQIFDFDKHDDAWFIAMEYVYGASLWELRRRCRELAVPFPPILVAEIGAQVARGLQYAHVLADKGKPLALVHRDVTPHNVLLSFDGGVKLTDFGIAKAGTSFTAPGMLKGKFAYMSPEQARGESVDCRTDVFALGITLWEMLTGGRLFEGDSDIAVLRAVQESLIAAPARLNPDVSLELSEVVLKALARPLDQRFQSAGELDRALAHFVLKHSTSTDDSNIGLFVRQMFRDELEASERAMSAEVLARHEPSTQTPIIDAYALGSTRQFNRYHDPPTQQTATPVPPDATLADRPKTTQMPGVRSPRPLLPPRDDDADQQRTDQLQRLGGPAKEATAQMPGLRSSRRLPAVAEAAAPSLPSSLEGDRAAEPSDEWKPRKSLLPWIVTACLAVGLIAGLTIAVQQARSATIALAEKPTEPAVAVAPNEKRQPSLPAEKPVKEEAPPEPVAPVDAPTAARTEPAVTAQPPAELPRPRGVLVVEAIPWAKVFINEKVHGTIEGTARISLAAGTYTVRFEHPRLTRTEPVVIKAGRTTPPLKFHPLQQ